MIYIHVFEFWLYTFTFLNLGYIHSHFWFYICVDKYIFLAGRSSWRIVILSLLTTVLRVWTQLYLSTMNHLVNQLTWICTTLVTKIQGSAYSTYTITGWEDWLHVLNELKYLLFNIVFLIYLQLVLCCSNYCVFILIKSILQMCDFCESVCQKTIYT